MTDTFVLFVDMMGFADLVLEGNKWLDELTPVLSDNDPPPREEPMSLLEYRFANFHRCLQSTHRKLHESRKGTCITFSDSAFFQIDDLTTIVSFARDLMLTLFEEDVPVRMGLANGSFRFLRSMTDSSSHVSLHVSQFLGSGVVKAYRAEHCGVPGLRILLHPDLEPLLDKDAMRIVAVAETAPKLPVVSEVNFLELDDRLHQPQYLDVIAFDSLGRMMFHADEEFHYHYVATFNAMNIMRAQFGREPYPVARFNNREEYERIHGIRPAGP